MIHRLVTDFRRHDRDIEALTYVLVALLLILVIRAIFLVYEGLLNELWPLLAPLTSLIAALLVVRVANRVILQSDITREDDRRLEVVRITHHLIATSKDLKGQVAFVKKVLEDGTPALALIQVAKSIEDRYKTLLDRDVYKLLPGKCIDIITNISGSIYGIGLFAAAAQQLTSSNPGATLISFPNKSSQIPSSQLEELLADIQQLIDELYRLRESIDSED